MTEINDDDQQEHIRLTREFHQRTEYTLNHQTDLLKELSDSVDKASAVAISTAAAASAASTAAVAVAASASTAAVAAAAAAAGTASATATATATAAVAAASAAAAVTASNAVIAATTAAALTAESLKTQMTEIRNLQVDIAGINRDTKTSLGWKTILATAVGAAVTMLVAIALKFF